MSPSLIWFTKGNGKDKGDYLFLLRDVQLFILKLYDRGEKEVNYIYIYFF